MKLLLCSLFLVTLSSYVFATEIVIKHMPEGKNCIICHKANDPKHLYLRNGTSIAMKDIDVLCGQCHGIKHRRWVEGRHGKVSGSWQEGKAKRLTCTECHNYHAPKFPSFETRATPIIRGYEHLQEKE